MKNPKVKSKMIEFDDHDMRVNREFHDTAEEFDIDFRDVIVCEIENELEHDHDGTWFDEYAAPLTRSN